MGKKSDSEKEALTGHESRENTLKEALKSNFSLDSEKGPQWPGSITRGKGRTVAASPGPARSWEDRPALVLICLAVIQRIN